jgi:hypothetical protein
MAEFKNKAGETVALLFLTKNGAHAARPLEPLIAKGLTVSGTLAAFFVPLGALILKG